ncbi:MAG: GTP pyrophosphokinase [Candidatus Nanopelagicales bacterium]
MPETVPPIAADARRPRSWAHREAIAYRKTRREYAAATTALVNWLSSKLADIDEIDASITGRAKDVRSVEQKLRLRERLSPGRDQTYADLPDLIGARVVVRLESEIEIVAVELHKLLAVDKDVNVREEHGREETPGYRGRHFDVRALPGSDLPDFLRDHAAEIQVRTRGADLWASVEHELRYKSRGELPPNRSRQFVLAASLLELAERELEDLRAWQVAANSSRPALNADPRVLDEAGLADFLAGRYPAAAPSTPRRVGWMLEVLRELHLDSTPALGHLLPGTPDRKILALVEGRATVDNVRMLDDELLQLTPEAYLKANRVVPDDRNPQRLQTLARRRRRLEA